MRNAGYMEPWGRLAGTLWTVRWQIVDKMVVVVKKEGGQGAAAVR